MIDYSLVACREPTSAGYGSYIWTISYTQQAPLNISNLNCKMTTCEKLPPWKASSMPNEPTWYFGYGSNMKASSMADRKITPLKTKAITVPTHFVTFDIFGIPYSEPSYASLEHFPDGGHGKLDLLHRRNCTQVPAACGVGHLLNPVDFHRLLVTEGSGVVYNLIEVQAYELAPDGRPILAPFAVYTLKAKWPQRPNGIPSARYMVCSRVISSQI